MEVKYATLLSYISLLIRIIALHTKLELIEGSYSISIKRESERLKQ